MATITELSAAYMAELEDAAKKNPSDYPWFAKQTATAAEVAARMFDAIKRANFRGDWMKHNEALRRACKKCGIMKSAELREFIKANWSSPFVTSADAQGVV